MCPFSVRVPYGLSLADFLGSMVTYDYQLHPKRLCLFSSIVDFACYLQRLHSSTGTSVRTAVVSLLRLHVTPYRQYGNINPSLPSTIAVRLSLRTRLTLSWLALLEETLVLRRGGFSPPLSLLMPTFAFLIRSRIPYVHSSTQWECSPTDVLLYKSSSFGNMLMPDYYPCPDRSTSELLRTL